MRVQPETLQALKSSGLTYSVGPNDLRALTRSSGRERSKMGFLSSTLLFLGAVVIFIAIARLHELYPWLLGWQLFLGVLAGVTGFLVFGMVLNRRSAADKRVIGERIAGIDDEMLWICKDDAWGLFTSPNAFARIVFDEGYIFAYVSRRSAHIFSEATLMRSPEGKAIHAWLARAKAEIKYGRRRLDPDPAGDKSSSSAAG